MAQQNSQPSQDNQNSDVGQLSFERAIEELESNNDRVGLGDMPSVVGQLLH